MGSFHIDRGGRPWLTPKRIKKISVECKTLDDVLRNYEGQPIDLLKIDVEGAELKVIDGASLSLEKTKRIEIEYGSEDNKTKLQQALIGHGFRLLLDHKYSQGRGDLFFI